MSRLSLPKNLFSLVAVVVVLGLAVTTIYFYQQYDKVKRNPNALAQEEIKQINSSLEKFFELPRDDEPSLATITDIEKLKDQPFFKKAKNGDKLLIYNKSQKAVLYRPSENKIVDFTLIGPSGTDAQTGQENKTSKVVLYNGTQIEGLTKTAEEELSGQEGLTIISKESAARKDYEKTLIVVLSGNQESLAETLVSKLKGEIAKIPAGEEKPDNADILVILGKNFAEQ